MSILTAVSNTVQKAEEFETVVGDFLTKLDLNSVPKSDQGICYLFYSWRSLVERSPQGRLFNWQFSICGSFTQT